MRKSLLLPICYALSAIWATFFICIGLSEILQAPERISKDKKFITTEITPLIATIDSFKNVNHRLPTPFEFHQIKLGNTNSLGNTEYIRNEELVNHEIESFVKRMNWSNNYVLEVWRGEWWEYYISDHHRYITNNYTKLDAYYTFPIFVMIAFIPLSVMLLWKRKATVRVNPFTKL